MLLLSLLSSSTQPSLRQHLAASAVKTLTATRQQVSAAVQPVPTASPTLSSFAQPTLTEWLSTRPRLASLTGPMALPLTTNQSAKMRSWLALTTPPTMSHAETQLPCSLFRPLCPQLAAIIPPQSLWDSLIQSYLLSSPISPFTYDFERHIQAKLLQRIYVPVDSTK